MLLVAFLFIYLALASGLKAEKEKVFCISVICFVTIVYGINEILSLFNALDYKHLFVFWTIVCISFVCIFIRNLRRNKQKSIVKRDFNIFVGLKKNKYRILFFLFFVAFFAMAVLTVPYNWDSMTYHLSRIAQWTQNKSIAHYAVTDLRQVSSPPLAEFVNLQVYIFSGQKDIFFNLLQCSSFAANAMLIYYIVKRLGAEDKYGWLGVLLFVSMPIAFAEALTTQVDQFSTLFLLMFVYFLLDVLDLEFKLTWNRESIWRVLILSSCIGYGYLAKPSILFAMVFFALWLLGVCIYRKDKVKDIMRLIALAVVTMSFILFPEILRNIVSFNSISTSGVGARQLVGTLNPVYVAVNGLKNFMMNLPNMYLDCTALMEHGVYWIAYVLGVEIDNPAIAEDGRKFFLHSPLQYNHDMAINPVIVTAMIGVMGWLIIRRLKKEKWTFADIYSGIAIGAFLFFCLVLRWEPFVTRYMLSYLALLCPAVAVWVAQMKKREYAYAINGILVFVCIVELAGLWGYHGKICMEQNGRSERMKAYFATRVDVENQYVDLIHFLKEEQYENIGLYLRMDSYEYPLWAMLQEDARIENVMVKNETSVYNDESFIPEVIIVIGMDGNKVSYYKEQEYVCYKQISNEVSVWKRNNLGY